MSKNSPKQTKASLNKKQSAPNSAAREDGLFLEYAKITSFGRFANKIVGPFSPGMTVVLGANEAGKTTTTELIKGVLFGWPSARGAKSNPYKPDTAERAGSLFFKNRKTEETIELVRSRNTDVVDDGGVVLGDIDQATYETMFALTSDELLQLDKHVDVTARLLTAGSGTQESPAHALQEIQQRISAETSRSAQFPESIPNLRAEQSRLRAQVQQGRAQAEEYQAQEKMLVDLEPRRATLAVSLTQINTEIENLSTAKTRIQELDKRIEATQAEIANALDAQHANDALAQAPADTDISALTNLTQLEEYRLNDSLDELDEARIKLDHAVDVAQANINRSQADYEAVMEEGQFSKKDASEKTKKRAQRSLALIVAAVLVLIGVYVLWLAQSNARLSYLVIGITSILAALLIAAVGVGLSLRPSKVEDALGEEREKKAWVVQQDKKALEVAQREAANHQIRIEMFLQANGLQAASGSLRRARHLLALAKENAAEHHTAEQNARALSLQVAALKATLADQESQRKALFEQAELSGESALSAIDALLRQKDEERQRIVALVEETNQQYGELKQTLSVAKRANDFAQAKQDLEVVEAKLEATGRRLASLLIAKRTLSLAIDAWEHKSQPEVYRRASELFSRMTGGAWETVRMNAQGEIEVVDAVKTRRLPQLLSLGTRQQLYLALRLALLMTASNVGKHVPLLCDDILVNFDAERRTAAASALIELSRQRQVILFTCHEDVADLITSLDAESNLLQL